MTAMKRIPWKPLLISLLVISTSTAMLYLLAWNYGTRFSWKDARQYLAAGYNFRQGNGLIMTEYEVPDDEVIIRPITYFPPLTSIVYGSLMFLGVAPENTPTIVTLLAWPLFLAGIGLLTYRLGRSWEVAAFAVMLAAITWPYLGVFLMTASEVVFLPLLVSLAIILTDLPKKQHQTRLWLVITAGILGFLMVTRYIAIFFYAAVLVWWSLWRLKQQKFRQLIGELAILSASVLPLLAWIIRNLLWTGHPFGPKHLSPHLAYTYLDTVTRLIKHSIWLVSPVVRPGPIWHDFGWIGAGLYLITLAVGFYIIWRYKPKRRITALLFGNPVLIFLAAYFGIFTIVQPFIYIEPIQWRYMTVALCLFHPWIFAMMTEAPRRLSYSFFSGFITLNLGLMILLTASYKLPEWITVNPPNYSDLADRPAEVIEYLNHGTPRWLLHHPPRTNDLAYYHQDVVEFLRNFDSEVVIISNAPDLFTYQPTVPLDFPVAWWLSDGTCMPKNDIILVIFDWDIWRGQEYIPWLAYKFPNPAVLRTEIEQKCPEVVKITRSRSVIYHLPGQTLADKNVIFQHKRENHRN